jgi:hypothetical protein
MQTLGAMIVTQPSFLKRMGGQFVPRWENERIDVTLLGALWKRAFNLQRVRMRQLG